MRAPIASARPTAPRSTSAWPGSRHAGTRPTCSARTRTSRRQAEGPHGLRMRLRHLGAAARRLQALADGPDDQGMTHDHASTGPVGGPQVTDAPLPEGTETELLKERVRVL